MIKQNVEKSLHRGLGWLFQQDLSVTYGDQLRGKPSKKNNPSGNPRYIRDLEGKRKHGELEDDVDLGKGFVGCAILTFGMLFSSATVDIQEILHHLGWC